MHAASATRITAACAIGVVLVSLPILIVLSQSPGDTPPSPSAAHAQAAAPAPPQTAPPSMELGDPADTVPPSAHPKVRRFGTTGEDEGLVFTVDPPTMAKRVVFQPDASLPTAHGHFVLVWATIANRSGKNARLPCHGARLFDTRDRVYKLYDPTTDIKGNKHFCWGISNGETRTVTLAFDVNADTRPAAVEMFSDETDDYGGEQSLVRFLP